MYVIQKGPEKFSFYEVLGSTMLCKTAIPNSEFYGFWKIIRVDGKFSKMTCFAYPGPLPPYLLGEEVKKVEMFVF